MEILLCFLLSFVPMEMHTFNSLFSTAIFQYSYSNAAHFMDRVIFNCINNFPVIVMFLLSMHKESRNRERGREGM